MPSDNQVIGRSLLTTIYSDTRDTRARFLSFGCFITLHIIQPQTEVKMRCTKIGKDEVDGVENTFFIFVEASFVNISSDHLICQSIFPDFTSWWFFLLSVLIFWRNKKANLLIVLRCLFLSQMPNPLWCLFRLVRAGVVYWSPTLAAYMENEAVVFTLWKRIRYPVRRNSMDFGIGNIFSKKSRIFATSLYPRLLGMTPFEEAAGMTDNDIRKGFGKYKIFYRLILELHYKLIPFMKLKFLDLPIRKMRNETILKRIIGCFHPVPIKIVAEGNCWGCERWSEKN